MSKRRRKTTTTTSAVPNVPAVQLKAIEGKMIREVDGKRQTVDTVIRQPLAVRDSWDDPDDRNTRSKSPRQVSGARRADPLLVLFRRGSVTADHYRAGEIYRDDKELAEGANINLGGACGGESVGPTEVQLDALQRHRRAKQAVGHSANTLLHVVLINRIDVTSHAEIVGDSRHIVMGKLIAALDRLAEHYRLPVTRGAVKTA